MSASGPAPFAIESSHVEVGRLRLSVAGELDLAHSPRLATVLEAAVAAGADVLLDLRRCELVDTTALAVIFGATDRLAAIGHVLAVVVPADGTLRRQFEVIGLLDGIARPESPPAPDVHC